MRSDHLELLRDFVNTLLIESGKDALATPYGLVEWLQGRGLIEPGTEAGLDDVARITEIREAIRELLGANTGVPISARAMEVLGRAARGSPLVVSVSSDGSAHLVASSGDIDGAIGGILLAAVWGMAEGSWTRLKLCRNRQCGRAFYDRSKNRSGVWCLMAGCGNRAKVRAYRLRKRQIGA